MPKDTRDKVTLTPEAYKALSIESMLMDCSMKEAASRLILKAACPKCKEIMGIMGRPPKGQKAEVPNSEIAKGPKGERAKVPDGPKAQRPSSTRAKRPKLLDNPEAVAKIKELWKLNPRPSYAEIGKAIDYPKATTAENIKKLKAKGELQD